MFLRRVYNVLDQLVFLKVNKLLNLGQKGEIKEDSAQPYLLQEDGAAALLCTFRSAYEKVQEKHRRKGDGGRKVNLTMETVWNLFGGWVILHALLGVVGAFFRFGAPVAFLHFVAWLKDYDEGDEKDSWRGWLWGMVLVFFTFVYTVLHHQIFLLGTRTGFRMRQLLIAAVHAKALRLNSSQVGNITVGKAVNLISNDVRRCDDACPFLGYFVIGPVELVTAIVLIGLELGFVPAVAGLSTMMCLVPAQTILSKHIGNFRRKSAGIADERIHLTSQLVSESKAVKMLGWETPFTEKVEKLRKKEKRFLTKMALIRGSNLSLVVFIQPLAAFVTFAVAWAQGQTLDITEAFYVLVIMGFPKLTMALFFIFAIEKGSELRVSLNRLDEFLSAPEARLIKSDTDNGMEKGSIHVEDADFFWTHTDQEKKKEIENQRKSERSQSLRMRLLKVPSIFKSKKHTPLIELKRTRTLHKVTFHVQPGELVGVVGRVGSGKTSLLLGLLDEIQNTHEGECMRGRVSYVAQVPWVRAGSVRDNILFDTEMERERYDEVVDACALRPDLEQFPHHDETELGERGINLSGGQKARLSLARAAYFKADINLLDDPLSAVDPSVGRILFERCIGNEGLMKNTTRVVVTHQRHYLPQCDRVAVFRDGELVAFGTWEHLRAEGYEEVGTEEMTKAESSTSLNSFDVAIKSEPRPSGSVSGESQDCKDGRRDSDGSGSGSAKKGDGQMIKAESKESGRVSWKVYGEFVLHIGVVWFIAIMTLAVLAPGTVFVSEWWLSEWATADREDQRNPRWIWVFGLMTAAIVGFALLFTMFTFVTLVEGTSSLHNMMIRSVMRSPLKFFHTNPTGRIVNRFAKDQGLVDDLLPSVFADVLSIAMFAIGTVVLAVLAVPTIIPLSLLLVYMFIKVRGKYVTSSREIKRYEGVTRSPIYAAFSENLKGLATIRAFSAQKEFEGTFLKLMDWNGAWWYSFLVASRWIGFRLDLMNVVLLTGSVLLVLLLKYQDFVDQISPQFFALAIARVIQLSGALQWAIRQSAELENLMTSAERMMEYTHLNQEPPRVIEGGKAPEPEWPKSGAITYRDVSASYRPELDPVLKHMTFEIPGGSSVGIVGRTGSGKSSLMLTLYRLIDLNSGSIFIDGEDISSLGIDALRQELAIIPQDPVLFGGSMRMNLDPWDSFSDAELWGVLSLVQLDQVASKVGGLDANTGGDGNSLSSGEKQLVCLARALLKDAAIVALDEATANVDRKTDAMIQHMLRQWVKDKKAAGGKVPTILTIAHRIDTIMDCDLLLVLHNGEVVEFGTPSELKDREDGTFAAMVEAAQVASMGPSTISEDIEG